MTIYLSFFFIIYRMSGKSTTGNAILDWTMNNLKNEQWGNFIQRKYIVHHCYVSVKYSCFFFSFFLFKFEATSNCNCGSIYMLFKHTVYHNTLNGDEQMEMFNKGILKTRKIQFSSRYHYWNLKFSKQYPIRVLSGVEININTVYIKYSPFTIWLVYYKSIYLANIWSVAM